MRQTSSCWSVPFLGVAELARAEIGYLSEVEGARSICSRRPCRYPPASEEAPQQARAQALGHNLRAMPLFVAVEAGGMNDVNSERNGTCVFVFFCCVHASSSLPLDSSTSLHHFSPFYVSAHLAQPYAYAPTALADMNHKGRFCELTLGPAMPWLVKRAPI